MMKRSKALEDTKLWHVYLDKLPTNDERVTWIKKVYEMAVVNLKEVAQEFRNYTLHDETHVLNVLDAMGGLLGDWSEKLTVEEIELLILAASLHDLGMVYTDDDKADCFEDETSYKKFLTENCPDLIGFTPNDWSEDVRRWYLRTLHPFRVSDVLLNKAWKDLFADCPRQIIPKRYILAVCQAHGEEPRELQNNEDLEYREAGNADPLFCALLLRLADLLDFDDTRAPKVLYGNTAYSEKSREEWDKHQASSGFRYPDSPSAKELPYRAQCKNPAIEHAVRKFLDWVDDELGNCARLQRYCKAGWRQEFSFPRAVSRKEIESDGYMSGDFCLTMDQDRILMLLMGENLYDNRDVFVRELLQNAIDATLLRGQMDSLFVPENARIDFREWSDSEGNLWFRIDDQGTGMTLGMMQRYFLKVGNSYYTSQELKRDLSAHGHTKEFRGISRFGIGFLSCFLCGDSVEVSTLYFDPQKNSREEAVSRSSQAVKYGLRLEVTGLTGYYTLKNQAENHAADVPLPMPNFYDDSNNGRVERNGYRAKPGTSIVLRLNPGKLGALNLRETVEKYLCAARVPVYYNDKRVGRTYTEAMQTIHEMAGENVYELSAELKKEFDECFPAVRGNYPKIVMTVIPLDTEENQVLPDFSGAIVKYDVRFEKELRWRAKDQDYIVTAHVNCMHEDVPIIILSSENTRGHIFRENKERQIILGDWDDLRKEYGAAETDAIGEVFETFVSCPETEGQLGESWNPFRGQMRLEDVWSYYSNYCHEKGMKFGISECQGYGINSILGLKQSISAACVYQGVMADEDFLGYNYVHKNGYNIIILLDGEWKPMVQVSRSRIVDLPLMVLVAMSGVLNKYSVLDIYDGMSSVSKDWNNVSLTEWREIRNSSVGQWMMRNNQNCTEEIIQTFQKKVEFETKYRDKIRAIFGHGIKQIICMYALAYLQDNYFMTINYEQGQIITFCPKEKTVSEDVYDIFPPMMFCKAASDESRKYICNADSNFRRGITADHTFIIWLLENAVRLKQYFERQFQQIVKCLYQKEAEDIVQEYSIIREQLSSFSNYHDLDVRSLPQISIEDFWTVKKNR